MILNPLFRGAAKYFISLMTVVPLPVAAENRLIPTSAAFPPSSLASEFVASAFQSIFASGPSVKEVHFWGRKWDKNTRTPSRCSLVAEGSKVSSTVLASPLSPANQNFMPSSLVLPKFPSLTRNAALKKQDVFPPCLWVPTVPTSAVDP